MACEQVQSKLSICRTQSQHQ